MFGFPLHSLIVHFPIALACVAFLYDGWAVYSKRPGLHRSSFGLTLLAAVSALAAVGTGLDVMGVSGIDASAITGHAGFGILSAILLSVVGFLRYSAESRRDGGSARYPLSWLVLQAVGVVLVLMTAVLGHTM